MIQDTISAYSIIWLLKDIQYSFFVKRAGVPSSLDDVDLLNTKTLYEDKKKNIQIWL